jgi:CRISPR/Cas system-associated protein Cas10 (large subunit of type III CRISPR-Cas system)
MEKYLYGLSIQGIQNYIFETSKLTEVIGASELVATLPKSIVEEISGIIIDDKDENLLINAAGNFKYIFDNEDICKTVFKNLPKEFTKRGGNITVSQTVIKLKANEPGRDEIDALEKSLKAEKNRQNLKYGLGLMSVKRVGETGNPESEDKADNNQLLKRNALDNGKDSLLSKIVDNPKEHKFTNNIEEITNERYGNWIAVIHADGNGLGKKIIEMADSISDDKVKGGFRELSQRLDRATENAVRKAFEKSILTKVDRNKVIPFRPVIIGGDDVTVIVRGDLALGFTESFLREFEEETTLEFSGFDEKFGLNKSIFKEGLTACAGVAFIKSHYPFHYGIQLAEQLIVEAKKESRFISTKKVPSSLMFHKMHSSFVRRWEEIKQTELNAGGISFANGPYFLNNEPGHPTVGELHDWVAELQRPISPNSNIRQWFSLLNESPFRAKELAERTKQISEKSLWKNLALETMLEIEKGHTTHLFDALTIAGIQTKK